MVLAEFFTLAFVSLFLYFLFWKPQNNYKGIKLPPGPIRFPVIGSLPQLAMIDKNYSYKQFTELVKTYGEIVYIGLGVHPTVVLSSFKAMNDLLKRPETNMNRYIFPFNEKRNNGQNIGIGWSWGETWTEVRRFTMKKLRDFGFGKTGSIENTVREQIDLLIQDIRAESEDAGNVWRINPNRLSTIAINVTWSSVGGYTFEPSSEFIKKLIDLNLEIFEVLRPTNLILALPFLKIFPEKSGYNQQEHIIKACREGIRELINDAKMKREGRHDSEAESLVEVFLDEIEKNRGNPETLFTEDQLEIILLDLFVASTDTTSAGMQWLILYFALNPKIQDRARAEIIKHSEDGTKSIPLTASSKMPYVVACIMESMRHPPFVSNPPPRAATCDIIYGDYVIPKGTCIMMNIYGIMHDPEIWGDHDVYRPERFLNSSETALDPKKMEQFPPFGFGKRICPGETMAMDVLFCFVTTLLSTFKIEAVPGMEPIAEPGEPSLTFSPAPYVAKFIPLH